MAVIFEKEKGSGKERGECLHILWRFHEKERETDRQTETETDRQTDWLIERDWERERDESKGLSTLGRFHKRERDRERGVGREGCERGMTAKSLNTPPADYKVFKIRLVAVFTLAAIVSVPTIVVTLAKRVSQR